MCGKKVKFLSKITLRNFTWFTIGILWPFKYSSRSGCSFLDFVKCTQTVSIAENLKPFSLYHTSKFRRHNCNFLSIEFRFF